MPSPLTQIGDPTTLDTEDLQNISVIYANRHKLSLDEQQVLDTLVRQVGAKNVPGTVANIASKRPGVAPGSRVPVDTFPVIGDDTSFSDVMGAAGRGLMSVVPALTFDDPVAQTANLATKATADTVREFSRGNGAKRAILRQVPLVGDLVANLTSPTAAYMAGRVPSKEENLDVVEGTGQLGGIAIGSKLASGAPAARFPGSSPPRIALSSLPEVWEGPEPTNTAIATIRSRVPASDNAGSVGGSSTPGILGRAAGKVAGQTTIGKAYRVLKAVGNAADVGATKTVKTRVPVATAAFGEAPTQPLVQPRNVGADYTGAIEEFPLVPPESIVPTPDFTSPGTDFPMRPDVSRSRVPSPSEPSLGSPPLRPIGDWNRPITDAVYGDATVPQTGSRTNAFAQPREVGPTEYAEYDPRMRGGRVPTPHASTIPDLPDASWKLGTPTSQGGFGRGSSAVPPLPPSSLSPEAATATAAPSAAPSPATTLDPLVGKTVRFSAGQARSHGTVLGVKNGTARIATTQLGRRGPTTRIPIEKLTVLAKPESPQQ